MYVLFQIAVSDRVIIMYICIPVETLDPKICISVLGGFLEATKTFPGLSYTLFQKSISIICSGYFHV